jgi:hypothetical protein
MEESIKVKKIGIPDLPNSSFKSDTLGIKPHAKALTTFIELCDTPITIGIQGEWGSGKTSLLNLIDRNLKGEGDHNKDNAGKFLQIWVNAWEHSLLSKPEETLIKIVNQIINQMAEKLKPGDKSIADDLKKKFKVLSKGALRVAAASVGGSEATQVVDELTGNDSNIIGELQAELIKLAKDINTNNSNYTKIVVYVDDLDRIDPPDAVAILELLKNIFNVEHCVFVLAIDYQVVVKGLEGKFGKRTAENEWEFRAFFDKIIQLPFMMPVGQYNVGTYVEGLLEEIGFLDPDQDDEIPEQISQMVRLSIGGNPRSLKRLVNSLSLIQIFSELKLKNEGGESDNTENQEVILEETQTDMLMFAIMCIQIKYPEIYEVIVQNPNFKKWDDNVALAFTDRKEETEDFPNFEKDFEISCGISWEEYKAHRRDGGKKYTEKDAREEFNEYWERVLFIICYINPRYRRRADEISQLLSYVDEVVLKGEETPLAISQVVGQTSVTSVTTTDDLKTDIKKPGDFKRTDYDNFDEYISFAKSRVDSNAKKIAYHDETVPLLKEIESLLRETFKNNEFIRFRFTPTGGLTLYVRKNTSEKWGAKWGAVTFGKTEPAVAKKFNLEKQFFVKVELSKLGPRYRKSEIINLFPSQDRHTSHMYTLEIRSIEDFKILLNHNLIKKTAEFIKKEGHSEHRKEGQPSNMKHILVEAKLKDYKQNLDTGAKYE